jgi:hypothetical protein
MAGLFINHIGRTPAQTAEIDPINVVIVAIDAAIHSVEGAFDLFQHATQLYDETLSALRDLNGLPVEDMWSASERRKPLMRSRSRYSSWQTQAARVFCMDLWAALKWMKKLNNLTTFAKSIQDTFDQDILAHCWPEIEDWQYVKDLRDAAAHAAEHAFEHPPKKRTNSGEGIPGGFMDISEDSEVTISFSFDQGRAYASWGKSVKSIAISDEILENIRLLRDRIFYALNVWPHHVRVNVFDGYSPRLDGEDHAV